MAAAPREGLVRSGGVRRCWWCGEDPLYVRYHDEEWGRPVGDDRRLFEKVVLEGFQSGLSWLTILRKREAFRRAFRGFDFTKVARFGPRDVERLLADASIVRHRGKIEAAITNARRATELVRERGSLAAFLWELEPPRRFAGVRSVSEASRALSRELKRRGWVWVGPTTMHALLQAVGIVNEHLPGCSARAAAERARKAFRPPR